MTRHDQPGWMAAQTRDEFGLNRVPEVTIFFWIIKILATTVGETAADFLSETLHLGLTVTSAIMTVLFIGVLVMQVRTGRYVPWKYWLTVVLISVVGTLVSDNLADNLGVPLVVTTIGFAIALTITFLAWYAREHTLSIHTIRTRRRELFYWAAILFTFALGTSGGDLASEGLRLGYWEAALIFGAMIAAVTGAYFFLGLDAVLAFWIAYILTRPFGASCGDFTAQPAANGGLGLGTVGTSGIYLAAILLLVAYLTVRQRAGTAAPELSQT